MDYRCEFGNSSSLRNSDPGGRQANGGQNKACELNRRMVASHDVVESSAENGVT